MLLRELALDVLGAGVREADRPDRRDRIGGCRELDAVLQVAAGIWRGPTVAVQADELSSGAVVLPARPDSARHPGGALACRLPVAT